LSDSNIGIDDAEPAAVVSAGKRTVDEASWDHEDAEGEEEQFDDTGEGAGIEGDLDMEED
jgi:hypothetical protein